VLGEVTGLWGFIAARVGGKRGAGV
jgi:hypothetical protein